MDTGLRPADYRAIWSDKPVLRAVYTDYYNLMRAACVDGPTLEIGGGSGNMKNFAHDVVSTDIVPAAWLDTVCDAQALPFADASFANIVMVDVLHHIARPARFLTEAERVLKPGGRVIMVEPGITPLSSIFFRLFHDEPVDMCEDPLDPTPPPAKDPFEGNQALPTRLFGRDRQRLAADHSNLRLQQRCWLSLFAYPLSGGFRPWSALPAALAPALIRFERLISPVLGPLMGFRLFAVLEKTGEG
jgi:SAM-dependent methyltransferase